MNLDRRLLRQLEPVRRSLVLTIVTGVLAGMMLVAQAYLLSQIIDRAFLSGATLAEVTRLLALLGGVTIARAAATGLSTLAAHEVASRVKCDLRERLLNHLILLGPAYTQGERSGELTATLTNGIEALDAYLSEYIPQLALAALIPLVMLLVVFPLDLLSGLVLLLTAPMIPFLMILIGKAANRQSQRQWTQLSRMSAYFLDVLQGLPTLKAFGRSREQIDRIADISERFRETTMSVLRVAFLSALVLEILATISTAIIAVEIGLRLLYGRIAFDQALFILILAPEYYLPLRQLGARFHAGVAGFTAAQRIFSILETTPPPPETHGAPNCTTPPATLPPGPWTIRFEAVSYTYADRDRPAVHDLTISLQPGEHVALVGPSGAGKSTITHLLLRFIEPSAGRITVDGVDLHALAPETWRATVAWVPQRPYLFDRSVADNIRLGKPDAPLEAVIQAARQAHADSFIRSLPQGYDTRIGERGARLSGGQAQRIALARAFLKDASIVILDEATANLDPETEQIIATALRHLLQGKTALIIAHRLSTVRNADRIVVLDGGYIVQEGPHDALKTQPGLYRQLTTAYGAIE